MGFWSKFLELDKNYTHKFSFRKVEYGHHWSEEQRDIVFYYNTDTYYDKLIRAICAEISSEELGTVTIKSFKSDYYKTIAVTLVGDKAAVLNFFNYISELDKITDLKY